MFRRLFAIAAVFIFLAAALPAFAGQLFDAQTAINEAVNNSGFYELKSKDGDDLNYISIPILSDYLKGNDHFGCLVYGQPHGDYRDGQYRYLGYTLFKDPASGAKEDYTNVAFPPDVAHTGYLEDQQWIREPWQNNDVTANYIIDYNNGIDGWEWYAQNIRQGILAYYTDPNNANNYQVKGVAPETKDFWDNIHQYVHILAPPTKYAWGIGRMWRHGEGGQINYITVPLMPDVLLPEPGNLKAVSIDPGVPQGQKAEPGKEYTATVVFENESDQAYPGTPVAVLHGEYQAALYDENGQVLPKKTIGGKEVQVADFGKKGASGAKRTFTCKWHPFAQTRDELTGMVNRDDIGRLYQEKTYEDNTVHSDIAVRYINLGVKNLHIEPNPGVPGGESTAYGIAFNDYDVALNNVPVVLYVDKNYQGSTVVSLPAASVAGPGETYFEIKFPTPEAGDHKIEVVINPARLVQTNSGRSKLDEWGLQVPDAGLNVIPEGYDD
ncbi:MAG: hypothetical protein K6T65_15885, partial [Peptococcaceae bacterium]|nr:hypothetical protein [Peptococcaceae bacterium]